MAIRGVLFDMDGVLVDSEPLICEAAILMFSEHGITVNPEDFLPFVGSGEDRYLGGVAEEYGFAFDIERDKTRTYAIYEEITHGKLHPLPGVHKFIKICQQHGLKLAVATSADKVKLDINLKAIGLPSATFQATLSGLDVKQKKPFPDIYLKAAAALKVAPPDCLVVEDAINGVRAGKAAGCRVLALTTSFTSDQLSEADWISHTLADFPEEAVSW